MNFKYIATAIVFGSLVILYQANCIYLKMNNFFLN